MVLSEESVVIDFCTITGRTFTLYAEILTQPRLLSLRFQNSLATCKLKQLNPAPLGDASVVKLGAPQFP